MGCKFFAFQVFQKYLRWSRGMLRIRNTWNQSHLGNYFKFDFVIGLEYGCVSFQMPLRCHSWFFQNSRVNEIFTNDDNIEPTLAFSFVEIFWEPLKEYSWNCLLIGRYQDTSNGQGSDARGSTFIILVAKALSRDHGWSEERTILDLEIMMTSG